MRRYAVDHLVRVYVWADDPEDALITARNALENTAEADRVTGIYSDPRHCHAKEAPE